jgi:DNA helicase-2/ATP-dependent DNA helicase PcrA
MAEYVLRSSGHRPFSIDYARELNPQQLEAVQAGDGPLLVIAGAGSGKTRTLTYRVARLIESGAPPQQILLLTFTNKAAREMLHRVESLLGPDIRRITGGTYHHVGHLVLRRHAELAGRRQDFTILDREDARDLMDDILRRLRKKANDLKFPRADVLIDLHSYSVNTRTPPERVLADRYPMFLEVGDEILRAIRAYVTRKGEMNLVDFDDLLLLWRDLLKREEIVQGLRAAWRHILVDEYQDTNVLQAEIVDLIAGEDGNLMVVGDDAQSIYSFRGANFGNIIDFPKRHPKARLFKLETNYRSTPQILDLANSSIRRNERQFPKVLNAVRKEGAKPERVTCGDVQEQAAFTVQRLEELRDEGFALKDIAILYRAHWHSMELQMELTRRQIPFQVRSGMRFFEQAHIKDVASYLKIAANPKDEMAWKRVAQLYPRIGRAAADKIWEAVARLEEPFGALQSDAVLKAVPRAGHPGWKGLAATLRSIAGPDLRQAPAEMIRAVLEGGYQDYLQATFPNFALRVEDVRRLADYSDRFADVQELLAELALAGPAAGAQAPEDPEDRDELVLTTVHQAKGLEWRAVFVLWLAEGKLPDARAMKEDDGLEEERRLFYVACTRAKDLLYLVHPVVADERRMSSVIQRPSIFLLELDKATYEQSTVGYERGSGY